MSVYSALPHQSVNLIVHYSCQRCSGFNIHQKSVFFISTHIDSSKLVPKDTKGFAFSVLWIYYIQTPINCLSINHSHSKPVQ